MTDQELDVLLIEDNPGDARLIEEMLRDAVELLQRVDLDGSTTDGVHVYREGRLSDGLERASHEDVDVILLDLNLPDSTGLDTLRTVAEDVEFVPIVVLTGLRDEQLGIDAIQHGAQDYLVKNEVTGDLLVRSIHYAIERARQERERTRRRKQLESLNRLNRIGQDVTHAVITTATREELEREVCERLVESDAYRFAWIGGVDRGTAKVVPRVAVGVEEGYLDEISIGINDDETAHGPTGRAVREKTIQIVQDVRTDPDYRPWRDAAMERGYRSSAAIPILYEDLLYGVLNVYAGSSNAFSEGEAAVLSRLGDVIGHAITALERKDALVSDSVLEFEFQVSGLVDDLVAWSDESGGSIEIDTLIRGTDGVVAYGRAEDITPEELRVLLADVEAVDELRILTLDERGGVGFELVTPAGSSLVRALAAHGGRIKRATIENGEFRFVAEFPRGRDKRQLVELVNEHCSLATPIAQRTVERPDYSDPVSKSALRQQLTEKQRIALRTAYFAGYFDWPRTSTAEDVADRLGVTAATFTEHLRTAERKFFEGVFEESRGDPKSDADQIDDPAED